MNNLKFLLWNVTKSHYLNNLNSLLWIYAERGATKTTPGLNPELFMPEEGNVLVSNSVGSSFGCPMILEKSEGKALSSQESCTGLSDKMIWYFQCPSAKNPPVLCAASPELHSFRQKPEEILDLGLWLNTKCQILRLLPWPINPGFCPAPQHWGCAAAPLHL